MNRVVETCKLDDGLLIKRLSHLKCRFCGARFFDDYAMHMIQEERKRQEIVRAV
jgi:hypothetical protein